MRLLTVRSWVRAPRGAFLLKHTKGRKEERERERERKKKKEEKEEERKRKKRKRKKRKRIYVLNKVK